MDPNLLTIKQSNMDSITHGNVREAIIQAENYLNYIHGFNNKQIQEELEVFIKDVKEIRKKSRKNRRNYK